MRWKNDVKQFPLKNFRYLIFQNQICLTDMYHTTITGIYTRYLDPNETQDRGKGGRFQNHSKHFITWYYHTMKVFSGGFV